MKKFKINKKVLILIIIALLSQCLSFQIGKLFISRAVVINTLIDDYIPFIDWFVYFYVIWFPLLILTPLLIANKDIENFKRYITTNFLTALIALIIFIVFPTRMIRYDGNLIGFTGFIMKIIYYVDTPLSCLPSMHVVLAMMFMFGVSSKNMSKVYKIFIYIVSPLIILATMFIKQHSFLDVISAIIITIIVWILAPHTKLYKYLSKKIDTFDLTKEV